METVSSRTRTRVAMYSSNDDNQYATTTNLWELVVVCMADQTL